ncbi:LOW QUALITY PROTEIN: G patch domain-containing protein 4 [Betta splendens]|uniref:G patch domain-containing protein 4 n=1 Tax=Betta splendens TaxID=158456 RepID=A0A6P7KTX1_BETSP|nr:LOW QUALITY PROTEIN: G patch domain-containing protein 4 [Betta splendens]
MADTGEERSCGLKFAEQQLLRHGWEHGKGLGKGENGRTEAIKVKLKYDKGGIGHKEGEQFTFHWWDHVFNKASSSLQVESDHTGIKLRKTADEVEDNGMISNKKPRKAMEAKAKLYGCFVKSATLLSGQEQPEPQATQSDDSSSSDDEGEEKLDLSSTTKLPDADLMKACGGRTAHKGARHGLTMSAKLARLEQQEAEFMAKYGGKSQTAAASVILKTSQAAEQTPERQEETPSKPQRKNKKSSQNSNDVNTDVSGNPKTDVKLKRKKRKLSEKAEEITEDNVTPVENEVDRSHKTKRKHKKKSKDEKRAPSPAPEEMTELHTDAREKKKKKKKKKSSKHQNEEEKSDYTESPQSEVVDNCDLNPRIQGGLFLEEEEVSVKESVVKQKRKRCKTDKLPAAQSLNEEEPTPKKKKKSKE